jgi:hypothetical protein
MLKHKQGLTQAFSQTLAHFTVIINFNLHNLPGMLVKGLMGENGYDPVFNCA